MTRETVRPAAPLWRWPALCEALGLAPVKGPDITGICIDSRQAQAGDLFIALAGNPDPNAPGGSRDGHGFLRSAAARGAVAALVTPRGLAAAADVPPDLPLLQVEDTLAGLWDLGRAGRARMQGQVVGITGSSGKTTARAWLQQLLAAQDNTHASVGSFNNHLGVPLSLARMPADARWGVFEVGMNNPGEIRPLAELVQMHVGLVLNVLPAHIGNFPNLDGIRQEKLSLSHGLLPGASLVVLDELDCRGVAADQLLRFGFGAAAEVRGEAEYHADHTQVRVEWQGRFYAYQLKVSGEHRVQTSLACFGIMAALGADLEAACAAMPSLTLPKGRGNEAVVSGVTLVDDSYNANPVSMIHGLDALTVRSVPGLRVAILGEMLELGSDGKARHDELRHHVESFDGVITVGEGFAGWPPLPEGRHWGHYEQAADIDLQALAARLVPGSVVLVKGSNKVFWSMDFVNQLILQLQGPP